MDWEVKQLNHQQIMTSTLSQTLLSYQQGWHITIAMQLTTVLYIAIEGNLIQSSWEEKCHLENIRQQKRLKIATFLRMPQEVRWITKSIMIMTTDTDVTLGEISEYMTESNLKLTTHPGKCMTKKTEQINYWPIPVGDTSGSMNWYF